MGGPSDGALFLAVKIGICGGTIMNFDELRDDCAVKQKNGLQINPDYCIDN